MSTESQSLGRSRGSRPSESDRAGLQNRPERPSQWEIGETPLTDRDGVTLREEVRDLDNLDGDRPLSWRESVREWREYILDTRDTDAVFQNQQTGEYAAGSDPHRFAPEYSQKQYAKLKDLERGLREDYGSRMHTAMLTFTASSTDDDGNPRPPVDHLHDLDRSWEAVRRELSRSLESKRWEYLAILEPHQSGYVHTHVAVFVDGVVTERTFASVIRAHVRNCPTATADAHDVEDDSTISINRVGTDREADELENLSTYLSEYLGTYGDDPLEAPDNQQMANALLWATGKQRWRPSQGAQQHMASFQSDDDDESPWEIVGIRSGTEYHPTTGATGGIDRFTTSTDRPPDAPPPG